MLMESFLTALASCSGPSRGDSAPMLAQTASTQLTATRRVPGFMRASVPALAEIASRNLLRALARAKERDGAFAKNPA
jgi:hypothetical protein